MSTDSVRLRSTGFPTALPEEGSDGGSGEGGYSHRENAPLGNKLRGDSQSDTGAPSVDVGGGAGFVVVREQLDDGFVRLILPWCRASILLAPMASADTSPPRRDTTDVQDENGPDCC